MAISEKNHFLEPWFKLGLAGYGT